MRALLQGSLEDSNLSAPSKENVDLTLRLMDAPTSRRLTNDSSWADSRPVVRGLPGYGRAASSIGYRTPELLSPGVHSSPGALP